MTPKTAALTKIDWSPTACRLRLDGRLSLPFENAELGFHTRLGREFAGQRKRVRVVFLGLRVGLPAHRIGPRQNQEFDGALPVAPAFEMHGQLHGNARRAVAIMRQELLAGAAVQ